MAKHRSKPRPKYNKYIQSAGLAGRALATAAKAAHDIYTIKGMINVEKHRHVITASGTTVNTSGGITSLVGIAQGDDQADRTGNSILVKGIALKMAVRIHASATASIVRIIFFIDTQQEEDTSPTVTDVINTANPLAPLSRARIGRFKILKNYILNLSAQKTPQVVINKYIKMHHHVRYNSSTSSDIQKGGIYMLIISNEATNTPQYDKQTILQFYDN